MPTRRYTQSTPKTASSVTACLARRLRTTPTTITGGASATSRAFASRVAPPSGLPVAVSTMLAMTTATTITIAGRMTMGFASAVHSASSSVTPSRRGHEDLLPVAGSAIPWTENARMIAPSSSP